MTDRMMQITVDNGVKGVQFNVRLVEMGDAFGLNDMLIHEKDEPVVEFYDARQMHTRRGQFISRYYLETLLDGNPVYGLILMGDEPEWRIDFEGYVAVRMAMQGMHEYYLWEKNNG